MARCVRGQKKPLLSDLCENCDEWVDFGATEAGCFSWIGRGVVLFVVISFVAFLISLFTGEYSYLILILVGLGFLLAIPWAIANWLTWQTVKRETILPSGEWTSRHGGTIAYITRFILLLFGVWLATRQTNVPVWPLWLLVPAAVMWFVGGWLACLVERMLYQDELCVLVSLISILIKDATAEQVIPIIDQSIPKWWIKLMTPRWQRSFWDGIRYVVSLQGLI